MVRVRISPAQVRVARGAVLAVGLGAAVAAAVARAEAWRLDDAPSAGLAQSPVAAARPPAAQVAQAGSQRVLTVCPRGRRASGCEYHSIARALRAARDGATVRIRGGLYEEAAVLRRNNITILARGAHMRGVAAQGKAALVINGDNTEILGLECSQIRVPDGNGACIRMQGRNLTLRGVYFHDSQQGVLGGGGRVLIEYSVLERLGGDVASKLGRAHGVYITRTHEFVLRNSRVLAAKEEGHEVKSRAERTFIEGNIIASLAGRDSRLIDVPNGGLVVIRNNVLQEGPNSSNKDLIGIGLERGRGRGDHALNRVLIEDNIVVIDGTRPARLVHFKNVPPPVVTGNTIVGGPPHESDANAWFPDRAAAGLPPYPGLPAPPRPED